MITQPADVVKTNVQVKLQLSTSAAVRHIYTVTISHLPPSDQLCHPRLHLKKQLLVILSNPFLLSVSGTRAAGFFQRGRATGAEEDHDGRYGVDSVRADDGPRWVEVLIKKTA